MNKNNYIKQLEETISKFLKPLKDIPFPIAIGFWNIKTKKEDDGDTTGERTRRPHFY